MAQSVQRLPAGWTVGAFPALLSGVKRPGRGLDHPPPSRAEVKERAELYLYSTSGPSWPVLGQTIFTPSFLHKHINKSNVFPSQTLKKV